MHPPILKIENLTKSFGAVKASQNITLELYKNEITIRRTGCSALDLAYIAAGRLDGFWGNGLKPWDVAAGIVIAEEAGALLSDFHGSPKYNLSENIVCCSPKCFKPILQAVKSNLEE